MCVNISTLFYVYILFAAQTVKNSVQVSGSFPAFFLPIATTSNKNFLKVKQLEIGNADVVNLGERGHKTGGCYARYQPFSSIKPGTSRAGLTGRFQNPSIWIIGTFIKEG
jgi:hypothetical protein